jgi:hypothetical protein
VGAGRAYGTLFFLGMAAILYSVARKPLASKLD